MSYTNLSVMGPPLQLPLCSCTVILVDYKSNLRETKWHSDDCVLEELSKWICLCDREFHHNFPFLSTEQLFSIAFDLIYELMGKLKTY